MDKKNYAEERETDEKTGKVYVKVIETRRFEEKRVNLPFNITLTRKVEVKEEAEPAEGDEQQPAEDKKKKKGFWRKLGIGLLAGGAVAVGGKAIYDRAHQDEDDDEDEEYDDEYDEDEDDEEDDDEEEDDE